jgi:riboflavin kinase/FMN adenylyltransferase
LKIYHKIKEVGRIKNPVLTVGTFDGLHKGHQKIFTEMKLKAQEIDGETVIVSFFPHPRRVLFEDSKDLKLILTNERKYKILDELGINHLLIIPFTKEFAKKSAETFVKEILVDQIGIKSFMIGYDHQFGKGRGSSYEEILQLGKKYSFEVTQISAEKQGDVTISSTKIREALKSGEIRLANKMLGFEYSISSTVVVGDKIGRTIGFPTANLELSDEYKLIAAGGVYACRVFWKGKMFQGMGNIGYRPTINGNRDLRTEVHIFDFDEMIYGDKICVFFVDRIRNEVKFDGLPELKKQLKKDELRIRKLFQTNNR